MITPCRCQFIQCETYSAIEMTEILTCRRVLGTVMIFAFMLNFCLRSNLSMAILQMIDDNTTQNISSQIPRYRWNEVERNDILGAFFWGYIMLQIIGGRLAEVYGSKTIMGFGMLSCGIITMCLPLVCPLGFFWVFAMRVLTGLSIGVMFPAFQPLVCNWVSRQKHVKFTNLPMTKALGVAINMPFCAVLTDTFGWPSVFYTTGALASIWSVACYFLVYDTPEDHPRISMEEKRNIARECGNKVSHKNSEHVPWLKILTSKPVWAIIVSKFCYFFLFNFVMIQMPAYLKQVLHYDIKSNGFLVACPFLGMLFAYLGKMNTYL